MLGPIKGSHGHNVMFHFHCSECLVSLVRRSLILSVLALVQACKPGDPDTDAGEDDSDSEAEEDPTLATTRDPPFRSERFYV